jgi:hypothetical protein
VRPPTTPQKIQRLDPLGLDKDGNKYYHLADDRLWIQRRAPSASSSSGADSPALDEGQYGQQAIKKPKTLLGLRAGPRDKSKKGTVTGTIRVKLKKDKVTGKYLQVTEDEPENEGEEDEEEKVHPEREVEEVEMPVWEREYWEERQRAENTPGFVEWEAVRSVPFFLCPFPVIDGNSREQVCTNLDEWRQFPQRFAYSTDANEIKLREKVALEVVPGIEEELAVRPFAFSALSSSPRLTLSPSIDSTAPRNRTSRSPSPSRHRRIRRRSRISPGSRASHQRRAFLPLDPSRPSPVLRRGPIWRRSGYDAFLRRRRRRWCIRYRFAFARIGRIS